ncbi:cellulose biosynthesis protein BcsE [Trinickia symbiotica]|uniref:Cellulose biosynthesis protein BcsE n=1 Tax=Trinickia symbiotica TaxID=863227 RepID=A0A2T3XMQ9_9BURK|nr:cellulose biosynthesis protein BcsE [Trinickia symbiotica]PTB17809.1 cellulose biosynthesis protein BcsE [Trinickia symbiotica]
MDERNQPAHERNEVRRSGAAASIASGGRSTRLAARLRGALRVSSPKSNRLAIDALPDEVAQLAPGKLYAIYAKPCTSACDALIADTAKAAATRHVTIVLSRTRPQAAARMRELGFGAGTVVPGWPRGLNVLAMPEAPGPDAASSVPRTVDRAPFARLYGGLRALKRFGLHANALVIVEGAERWLTWGDPDALAREGMLLANWCAARRITLVLLLDRSRVGREAGPTLHPNADEFMGDKTAQHAGYHEFHGACAGVARMNHTHGELLWHVEFWRAGRALATGETRALRFTEDGHLSLVPESIEGTVQSGLRLARDEMRVVATRAVVASESWVPPQWEVVADPAAAVAACAGAQAATVLLDYRDRSMLEPLCAAVHRLRRDCGRALKIVVVERREALRHQYELLLLSLGANLIVGRDLPFSRMQSLLRSLHGQLDTRPIAADYRAALAAALTDNVRGYLPVAAFCERIEAVLARGAVLDLPHVLAKVMLLPDVAHMQALRHCAPRRAGDVLTADSAHLYVFLFACRLPDADTALQRIFTVPVEHVSDRVVYLAEASIEREVKELAEANRRVPIADYGDLFPPVVATRDGRLQRTGSEAARAGAVSPSAAQAVEGMPKNIGRAPEPERPGAEPWASTRHRLAAHPSPPRTAAVGRRGAQPWPMPVRGEQEAK